MRVLVTGASGLVGRPLVRVLAARGDSVVALSREPARHTWPSGVEPVAWDARSPLPAGLAADAAVNLAGEPVMGRRWTQAQLRRLRDSRLDVTRHLVYWCNAQAQPPALVSAGAAGYYGPDAVGPCPESRPAGAGFLAGLARDWEAEAQRARARLVVLRIGLVLSADGGYLGTLLPYARRGLAGPIAGGRQPVPWVHADDVVRAFLWALDHPVHGTFNVVSPGAAGRPQRELADALGRAVGRPRQLSVPVLALRVRFGAGAIPAIVGGQDLRADAIQRAGFRFRHEDLSAALRDLLAREGAAG